MSNAAPEPVIEYFYAAHSVFAYLGAAKFMDIARAAGRQIVHKPFDYTSVVTTSGAGSTRERGTAHRSYYFGRRHHGRLPGTPLRQYGSGQRRAHRHG
jgi:2-hydroxychromene-2-carboxylate isomerase